jgi:hypothetical protein
MGALSHIINPTEGQRASGSDGNRGDHDEIGRKMQGDWTDRIGEGPVVSYIGAAALRERPLTCFKISIAQQFVLLFPVLYGTFYPFTPIIQNGLQPPWRLLRLRLQARGQPRRRDQEC